MALLGRIVRIGLCGVAISAFLSLCCCDFVRRLCHSALPSCRTETRTAYTLSACYSCMTQTGDSRALNTQRCVRRADTRHHPYGIRAYCVYATANLCRSTLVYVHKCAFTLSADRRIGLLLHRDSAVVIFARLRPIRSLVCSSFEPLMRDAWRVACTRSMHCCVLLTDTRCSLAAALWDTCAVRACTC